MNNLSRIKLSALSEQIGFVDLLICSVSYESRSLALPLALSFTSVRGRVLAFVNVNHESNRPNLLRLQEHFSGKDTVVECQSDNPLFMVNSFIQAIQTIERNKPLRILVDSTSFTHESLLILLKIMQLAFGPEHELTIGYTPAEEYAVGLEENQKWLSKGVKEIRSIVGYPGTFIPAKPLHLIVLVGFEADRAQTLLNEYEPQMVSLGVGMDTTIDCSDCPSVQIQQHQKLNVDALERLSANYETYYRFEFSCVNPWDTCKKLKEQVRLGKEKGFNTVIAPMNTKLSTIGTALLALEDESIQICYAPALTYNVDGYSKASDGCVLFQLKEVLTGALI